MYDSLISLCWQKLVSIRRLCCIQAFAGMAMWLLQAHATSFDVETPLADPSQEHIAQSLFAEILCEVCQGQAINSSEAEFAKSMRAFIREQLASGANETTLRATLTRAYGSGIWLSPPLSANTYLLWFAPFLLLSGFAIFLIFRHNRR